MQQNQGKLATWSPACWRGCMRNPLALSFNWLIHGLFFPFFSLPFQFLETPLQKTPPGFATPFLSLVRHVGMKATISCMRAKPSSTKRLGLRWLQRYSKQIHNPKYSDNVCSKLLFCPRSKTTSAVGCTATTARNLTTTLRDKYSQETLDVFFSRG